ncbi:MAG: hypothetical protein SFV54_07760 [Bryobacteraceae bacterium]|nr:hypothetical protein [Bryobacteraceae bacterium]
MLDYEKLGSFYLGRRYDLAARQAGSDLVLYDSKDLVTHAVCVGMTGSGKTGLCIDLLEEAAIDGIPALVIDPKGDLGNLLLTFPDLAPADFRPWVSEDEARQKGLSPDQFAAQQSELWRNGLASWGQDAARIRRLKESADFSIYTPGSEVGLPVSVLKSFAAPAAELRDDREAMRERVSSTATALLGLLGIEGDPLQSREHILLSTLLHHAWQRGEDLDLAALIHQIQQPPVTRVGVLELEAFYPSKERFGLAMSINHLLASPGFEAWMHGEPLDIRSLLYTAQGKPRISIFSISHLSDAERMFFVSLLLSQTVSWMRQQSGSTSLRALVYMDEIFGYFPPVANPPSKQPLLTLLKQARAFGVGVVLATQNPVDLDYKGLANCGTWFIGRLQTERDKARVLEGLEGAVTASGGRFDRQAMEQTLAGLGNRVFLLHNVHEDAPLIFETRWALSYLRGPLARPEIQRAMAPRKAAAQAAAPAPAVPAPARPPAASASRQRTVLPPEIQQFYLTAHGEGAFLYRPMLYGSAQVRYADTKTKVDRCDEVQCLVPLIDEAVAVHWEEAVETSVGPLELAKEPLSDGEYEPVPAAAAKPKSYAAWNKAFVNWIVEQKPIQLLRSPATGAVSKPGESERDFRIRLNELSHEKRDALSAKIQQKYGPRLLALDDRIRRAEGVLEREQLQARSQKMDTAMAFGGAVIDFFLTKKVKRSSTSGFSKLNRSAKEAQDIERAAEALESLQQQRLELQQMAEAELQSAAGLMEARTEILEPVVIRAKKTNVAVRLFTLVWTPYRRDEAGDAQPAWQ